MKEQVPKKVKVFIEPTTNMLRLDLIVITPQNVYIKSDNVQYVRRKNLTE